MEELIKVSNEDMTVSARDLHEALGIHQRFSVWFDTNAKFLLKVKILQV